LAAVLKQKVQERVELKVHELKKKYRDEIDLKID
jgi:hypothetical protein